MLLVSTTLYVRLFKFIGSNITPGPYVHNELQVVMQETNFMQFPETQACCCRLAQQRETKTPSVGLQNLQTSREIVQQVAGD